MCMKAHEHRRDTQMAAPGPVGAAAQQRHDKWPLRQRQTRQ